MWSRSLLKNNAKQALHGRYWSIFVTCLAAALLTGELAFSTSSNRTATDITTHSPSSLVVAVASIGFLTTALLSIAWNVLVAPVIRVGRCRYMMANRHGPISFSELFSGFQQNYWNVVISSFYISLRIVLFTLLLIVPGIIKSYQYYFVPYLLAENPNLSPERAAELSTLMTNGEKWDIFLLQLSFIGWFILGFLCFGVGSVFVAPYYQATMAELYAAARAKAKAHGYTDMFELSRYN